MKDEADALLADLELKRVLGRLECDETTETLFHGYFVPKPGGKRVQLVTDYTPINPYIERPVHPFPSPDIVFQSVGKDSKWFAKLDALHGYYQIPLAPESQKLTAFLLPHRHPERDGVRESRAPGMTKKKFDGMYYSIRFAKKETNFHFDPEDIVKCNFSFPDGWQQQQH